MFLLPVNIFLVLITVSNVLGHIANIMVGTNPRRQGPRTVSNIGSPFPPYFENFRIRELAGCLSNKDNRSLLEPSWRSKANYPISQQSKGTKGLYKAVAKGDFFL